MTRGTFFSTLLALLVECAPFANAQSLNGVWRSEGYGYVFEISDSSLKAFDVTETTCVFDFMARRNRKEVAGREATFSTKDGDVYLMRSGSSADHKLLHSDGAASHIRIDRLPKTPDVCNRQTGNTTLDNFEVFTHTFAEHYISFDLKHVDWDSIVAENRQRVKGSTSTVDLFDILQSMIKPFGDRHTFINSPQLKRNFRGIRPGTDRVAKGGFAAFYRTGKHELLGVTDRSYIQGRLRKFCNDQIEYGHVDDTTGYMRIWSFARYSKQSTFDAGSKVLQSALDQIFSDQSLKTLVIDVRVNGGGFDPWGLDIASRLATTEYVAYTKYARADSVDHNKWTEGDPSVIRPSSRPGFHGPVVLLTGPLTISGGETFAQALMGRTPKVIRVGENTQGVFSDVLGRRLPNGWTFGLPNEVYRTSEGTAFDGVGITPDIVVPVFADDDVAVGRDPAMAKAIEILRNK
jgi:hypothetical protein